MEMKAFTAILHMSFFLPVVIHCSVQSLNGPLNGLSRVCVSYLLELFMSYQRLIVLLILLS